MVTAEEVLDLSDLDLEGLPPCSAYRWHNRGVRPCGRPSVARMHVHCNACGHDRRVFVCEECREYLINHRLACAYCFHHSDQLSSDYTVTES